MYFKNPPRKGKGKPKKRKKARTAKQKAATAKLVRLNKSKAKKSKPRTKKRAVKSTKKRTVRKTTKKRGTKKMAKKRRSSKRRGSSGRRVYTPIKGKVYRGNPPVLKRLTGGLKDAAFVKVGGIAGQMISGMVPVTGLGGTAVKAAVAVALSFAPVGSDSKRFLVAGAMQPVLDDLLAMAGLDKMIGGGGVSAYLPGSDGVSAYLSGSATEGDAYVTDDAVGAYVDY